MEELLSIKDNNNLDLLCKKEELQVGSIVCLNCFIEYVSILIFVVTKAGAVNPDMIPCCEHYIYFRSDWRFSL